MDLETLGITKAEIIDRIAILALERFMGDGYDEARKEMMAQYSTGIQKAIDEVVSKSANEALNTTFQPVNRWGEKTGEPTTVRDLFLKSCVEWWSQQVDCNGKPTSDRFNKNMTRAEYLAKQIVSTNTDTEMRRELKGVIDNAKVKLSEAIGSYLGEHVKAKL